MTSTRRSELRRVRPTIMPRARRGRTLLVVVVALLAVGFFVPQTASGADASTLRVHQAASAIPSRVSLVVSPPFALSGTDLTASDFSVRDGVTTIPATVTALAGADLRVAVVVDLGSTNDEEHAALGATDEVIRTLPRGAKVALITATEPPVIATSLTDDRPSALGALSRLRRTTPGSWVPALAFGRSEVGSDPQSRPTIVAISPRSIDSTNDLGAALATVDGSAAVYIAAPTAGAAASDLVRAAQPTGGQAVLVDQISQLIGATDQITSELGSQYRLDLGMSLDPGRMITVAVSRDGVEAQEPLTLTSPAVGDSAPAEPPPSQVARRTPSAEPAITTASGSTGRGWWLALGAVAAVLILLAIAKSSAPWLGGTRRVALSDGPPGGQHLDVGSRTEPRGGAHARVEAPTRANGQIPATETARTLPSKMDVLRAARQADEALLLLDESLRSPDADVPVDALVLHEAVARANRDGLEVALQDQFCSRTGDAPGVTDLAPQVERLVEATEWGFAAAADGDVDRDVLQGMSDRRGREHLEDHPNGNRPGRHAQTHSMAGPMKSPALRAVLAGQIVGSGWPDAGHREWLGRSAVLLSLARDGVLAHPIIDLSGATPAPGGRQDDDQGELASVESTLMEITASCTASRERLAALGHIRRTYLRELSGEPPSRAPAAVDVLMVNPVITAPFLAEEIGLSHHAALDLIGHFEERNWLRDISSAGRDPLWIAPEVMAVLEAGSPQDQPLSSTGKRDQS